MEFILSLFSTCRYDYVLCFHKEGKTAETVLLVVTRMYRSYCISEKWFCIHFLCIQNHLNVHMNSWNFVWVCANYIISQSSLFSCQINSTLFADNTFVCYWSFHSDDGFQGYNALWFLSWKKSALMCCPKIVHTMEVLISNFASSPFIVWAFQNCVPKCNFRDISLSEGFHSPS